MNPTLKNVLGLALVVGIGVAALSALWFVRTYATSIDPSSLRSFTVSAQGEAVSVPDIARFSFTVLTEGGTNLEQLQEQNSQKMNSAIEYVKAQGVAAEDIQTQQYDVRPRYTYYTCERGNSSCPPPTIVGYTVEQTVRVKVRDFSKVGDLLSGVVTKGANTVSQLTFTIDDKVAAENEARAKAIEKAKEKATAIAAAGGFQLGRILTIQENSIQPYYAPTFGEADEAFGRGGATPSIEPGSQEITATVLIRYEIK